MEKWTKKKYQQFLKTLCSYQDQDYFAFNQKIVGKTKYKMIGIRTPILNDMVKKIKKTDVFSFLDHTLDMYYEEVLIEGFVIASLKENQESYLEAFVSKMDNWAVCDMMASRMKRVGKEQEEYVSFLLHCFERKEEFSVRFGFVLLLHYYMEEKYFDFIFDMIGKYQQKKYYVQMAIAWLLSYMYLVKKERVLSFLGEENLDPFIRKKTISKIRDSYRVTEQDKRKLKKLWCDGDKTLH